MAIFLIESNDTECYILIGESNQIHTDVTQLLQTFSILLLVFAQMMIPLNVQV